MSERDVEAAPESTAFKDRINDGLVALLADALVRSDAAFPVDEFRRAATAMSSGRLRGLISDRARSRAAHPAGEVDRERCAD